MTKAFTGKIHSNGYLYLKAKSNAIEFLEIMSHFYPSRYTGTLNATGLVNIKASGKDFQIIGSRVPSVFIGNITTEGEVILETTESWFEIDGHVHVNKIIADPFKGNSQKRRKFLENRTEIRKMMKEWKINNNVGQQ
jgi:cytoskeletal protein CcmA (bactofilin family)